MDTRFSRRTLLAGAAALAAGSAARAESFDPLLEILQNENQAEWSDGFDSLSRKKQVSDFYPTLSDNSVANIENSLREYAGIVERGGWQVVPETRRLRLGARSANVQALRARLAVSGDLDPALAESDVFDSYVDAAVRNFQARHGMAVDGIIGSLTISALNIPANVRFRQLQTNYERLKDVPKTKGNRFVMVNIPAAAIETVEGGRIHSRHTAVVGKIDRQTPILESAIHEVNFNPYWTVPVSIIRKDLIPLMQEQPNYLTEYRIRIFSPGGDEIAPEAIDWFSDEAVNYRFRQDPGDFNSLGQMRINFQNPHAVYLHDTPDKNLFGKEVRFHSSGCVRVQNVREFVQWLLKETPGWSRRNIDQTIKSGERTDADISNAVPLLMTYVTAWGTPTGVTHFRDDVYNIDGIGPVALR
ncbi:MAG: L,D-transpeptidase family protein [Pseudomonadota bacterium]